MDPLSVDLAQCGSPKTCIELDLGRHVLPLQASECPMKGTKIPFGGNKGQ